MFYNETGFYESTLTAAELAYIDGLTPGTITANKAVVVDANKDIGDFNDVSLAGLTSSDLTASEIVISNASKKLVSAPVATYPSLTELSYVKGVTSAVQTQINAKAPIDAPTFTNSIELTSGDFTASNGNFVVGTTGKGITSDQADLNISATTGGVNVTTHSDAGDDFTVNSTDLVIAGDHGNISIGKSINFNTAICSAHYIQLNSVDGGDTGELYIRGGPGGVTRGGLITLFGNDSGGLGQIDIQAGDEGPSSDINLHTNALKTMTVEYNGDVAIERGDLVIATTAKGITSAQADLNISATTGGVNVTTHSDAGDDFTVNTTDFVIGGDDGNVDIGKGDINIKTGFVLRSTTAGITAGTTQTQGQVPLTTEFNEVSTVGTTNDVVTLPSAVAGKVCEIINNGSNTLQIFPASGDNAGGGVDTGVTLAAGSNVRYITYNATNWEIN